MGRGAVKVGATVAVGKVGVKVGAVGVKVGAKVGAVGTISGVGQNEIPPPKVGVVGTGAVKGVNVGKVGKVGVKVGTVGVKVGAVPNIIAVGQSEIPPKVGVVGAVMVGVKVGSIKAVAPGAMPVRGAVGNAVSGDVINAKPLDETKIKTVIINKLMKNNLSDFI